MESLRSIFSSPLEAIFWFLIVLTPVVFVHELGHYLIARWNRVRIEVFSIGFGPEIFGFTDRAKTRWKFSLLPLGGYVVCLHGSLQHEAVHGFPFRRRLWNSAIVFPSLWLWLPYTHYRETHLRHHRNDDLTFPVDPESNYLTPEAWARWMQGSMRWWSFGIALRHCGRLVCQFARKALAFSLLV